jgi:hypothetical protein
LIVKLKYVEDKDYKNNTKIVKMEMIFKNNNYENVGYIYNVCLPNRATELQNIYKEWKEVKIQYELRANKEKQIQIFLTNILETKDKAEYLARLLGNIGIQRSVDIVRNKIKDKKSLLKLCKYVVDRLDKTNQSLQLNALEPMNMEKIEKIKNDKFWLERIVEELDEITQDLEEEGE